MERISVSLKQAVILHQVLMRERNRLVLEEQRPGVVLRLETVDDFLVQIEGMYPEVLRRRSDPRDALNDNE